jgi:hypothetical protein
VAQAPLLHGDVTPRLHELIDQAGNTWGIPVRAGMIARATQLDPKIIYAYLSGKPKRYDLGTLAKLRWFFQCGIDDLLQWEPPAGRRAACTLPAVRVGKIELPREAPPQAIPIANRVPIKRAAIPTRELIAGTGLARNTILALQERPLGSMKRATISALCDVLSRRESRYIALSEWLG